MDEKKKAGADRGAATVPPPPPYMPDLRDLAAAAAAASSSSGGVGGLFAALLPSLVAHARPLLATVVRRSVARAAERAQESIARARAEVDQLADLDDLVSSIASQLEDDGDHASDASPADFVCPIVLSIGDPDAHPFAAFRDRGIALEHVERLVDRAARVYLTDLELDEVLCREPYGVAWERHRASPHIATPAPAAAGDA